MWWTVPPLTMWSSPKFYPNSRTRSKECSACRKISYLPFAFEAYDTVPLTLDCNATPLCSLRKRCHTTDIVSTYLLRSYSDDLQTLFDDSLRTIERLLLDQI